MNFIRLCNHLLLLVLVMTLLYGILQKEVPQTVTELLSSLGLEKYLVLFQAEEVTFEASITKLFASIYLNIFLWVISHFISILSLYHCMDHELVLSRRALAVLESLLLRRILQFCF